MQTAYSFVSDKTADDKGHKKIKNIYINKINSLMKLSGDIHDLPQKEKKIKKKREPKEPKEVWDKKEDKKEKNRDAAKKARLRKKQYIELLEGTIEKMERWVENGDRLENESQEYLKKLQSLNVMENNWNSIEQFFSDHRQEMILNSEIKYSDPNKNLNLQQIGNEITQIQSLGNILNLGKNKDSLPSHAQEMEIYNESKQSLNSEILATCRDFEELQKQAYYPKNLVFDVKQRKAILKREFFQKCYSDPKPDERVLNTNIIQAQNLLRRIQCYLDWNLNCEE